jgi:hypothetical protein
MTTTTQTRTKTRAKTPRVLGLIVLGILYGLMIPVAVVTVIVWYTFTWPWYLYRAGRRVAFPR